MKKLNRRDIRKMLTQMLSEASEFGDMKTSNTYTYKNDGYTYLVMDDMWYVIKGKKKSASSTKDYISLENNGTALNRLDKEHPNAREDKSSRKSLDGSFDDFKKWVDDDHERNTAFSNKEKQIIGKTYTSIKSSIKEIRKMLVMKPKEGSSFVFMIDQDPARGQVFLNEINDTIKKIEEFIAANDIQNLTKMTKLLNRYSDVIQKKVTSTPLDAKKLRNVIINLTQSISSLGEYASTSGSSNVAKSIKEAVFNRLKKKVILEQSFNVETEGTGEKFNGNITMDAGDEYFVDNNYVLSSDGQSSLALINDDGEFTINQKLYFIDGTDIQLNDTGATVGQFSPTNPTQPRAQSFNVATAGTGERIPKEGRIIFNNQTIDIYYISNRYVQDTDGINVGYIDDNRMFTLQIPTGNIDYMVNGALEVEIAGAEGTEGLGEVVGKVVAQQPGDDIEFQRLEDNPEVVDAETGEQDVAKIKYNKNTECIQKIVDPYEVHTKHDGDWGKNTQKAWEMYIKGEYTVLGKKSEYSGGERSMSTDVDGDGSTRTFKPNFDRKFKQTFPNVATSEMEALKKDLLKNTSVLTKLGYQKGAKHVCQFLKDINMPSVVKDSVGDIGYSQTPVNESLSRGSIYRRRYHGRY